MKQPSVMTQSVACAFSGPFWDTYKFTGKERDTESGLDNFNKRYFGSSVAGTGAAQQPGGCSAQRR